MKTTSERVTLKKKMSIMFQFPGNYTSASRFSSVSVKRLPRTYNPNKCGNYNDKIYNKNDASFRESVDIDRRMYSVLW